MVCWTARGTSAVGASRYLAAAQKIIRDRGTPGMADQLSARRLETALIAKSKHAFPSRQIDPAI
jgi:hypothetical protein